MKVQVMYETERMQVEFRCCLVDLFFSVHRVTLVYVCQTCDANDWSGNRSEPSAIRSRPMVGVTRSRSLPGKHAMANQT
jgi:hypothetical protein